MQNLSLQIDVSDTVSSNRRSAENPMAARLLSPNVVRLDARAFKVKPAERTVSIKKAYGSVIFALLILVMLVAKWIYLPINYSAKEIGTTVQILTPPPLPVALEISGVKLRKISINGKKIALVVGHITNRSGDKLPIPQLNIVLRQKDGQNVTSWRYRSQQTSLKAGASYRFKSKFNTDVKEGSVVEIQFASKSDR